MTKGVLGLRACDLCGSEDAEERRFAVQDPDMYSIDLCAWCWDDLLKALFKYLFKARRTSPSGRTGEPNPFASRIRVWAWENGYQVKSYGPLSRDVLDAYFGAPGQEEADRAWLEELDRKKAEAAKKDRRYVYPPQRPCVICGATPVIARNWCWPHLQRFYRNDDPLADKPLQPWRVTCE